MSLYLVSYELAHSNEFSEYEYFYKEMQKFRAQRVMQNLGVLRSSLNAETIRNALVKFVHGDDRILVVEINRANWAGWKATAEITDA
jgi:hypothetical protein